MRLSLLSLSVLLVALVAACAQPTATATLVTPTQQPTQPPTQPPASVEDEQPTIEPCIPSGDHASIQNALTGPGSKAVLCPSALFELSDTVTFTDDKQQIHTQGYPTDDSRALLRVVHKDVSTAVSVGHRSGVTLSHVIIDGNRPELGVGAEPAPGVAPGGLIEWGGNGTGTLVEWVKAYEPRGWSVLVIGHGDALVCSGSIVRNNELGPGGRANYAMADGISLGCRNSIVENNTIVDVTDGGIVIFQAPGSLVANNTIRAENRIMFYGIAMGDYGPYDGDFTGTRVVGNVIDAAGALIRRGIAMGPYVGCIPTEEMTLRSRGAVVTGNTLKGEHMGYGFVVSGVEDWTAMDNTDLSRHLVPEKEVNCFGRMVDPPSGFQLNPLTSEGAFQQEFEEAQLGFTRDWWPAQTVASEACMRDLIGAEALEEIKAGERGEILLALETSENGELIERCISTRQLPYMGDSAGEVAILTQPCEPLCVQMELINISDITVDLSQAEFFLEWFPVQCHGLPASVAPRASVRCTIEDYVTEGFQLAWWTGFPASGNLIVFEYPFEGGG